MLNRYRQRRGPYALAEPSPVGGIVRRVVILAVVALLLYWLVSWTLGALGVGNHLERKAVQLEVEQRSNVTVSLEGGLMQRPEGRVPLWPGDRVVSNANGHALLTFFDQTLMRIDEQSELTIDESSKGTKTSDIGVNLVRGALWVRTPEGESFSGAIARWVETENYTAYLPADADVVLGAHSVLVFSADGDGVRVAADGADGDIVIGEGQQLVVPEDATFEGDLRRYRSAMDPLAVRRAFIEESRRVRGSVTPGTNDDDTTTEVDLITVETPTDGQTVSGSTVRVQGKVGARVERVRVNGYPATIVRASGTYSQELAVPATETFTIRIEALDRTGVVVEQQERTVKPGVSAATAGSPSIVSPGKNGETVRTADEEIEIRGTAPQGTAAIYVNDYKLLLFRAGDDDWSYLASTRLTNLQQGANIFNVIAEDTSGNRSAPATLTIILGETGPTTPTSGGATSSAAPAVSEESLPKNDPLKPGTLAVTAPQPGTSATHTGTGFLLEGTTIRETASVWVNGYRLQLYEPGKTFWNYWALPKYNTLKPGTNTYVIVSRNAESQVLDRMTYTVEYTP